VGSYRGTSLIRNSAPLAPYIRTMPRALWWSQGGGLFLMSEVRLQDVAGVVASGPHFNQFPLLLDCRSGSLLTLPTETKVECGTSQSKKLNLCQLKKEWRIGYDIRRTNPMSIPQGPIHCSRMGESQNAFEARCVVRHL